MDRNSLGVIMNRNTQEMVSLALTFAFMSGCMVYKHSGIPGLGINFESEEQVVDTNLQLDLQNEEVTQQEEKEEIALAPQVENWSKVCPGSVQPFDGYNLSVDAAAEEFGVPAQALATILVHESTCNPNAVGGVGELGLGQIYPKIWLKGKGWKELQNNLNLSSKDEIKNNPHQNIRAAAYILSQALRRAKGNLKKGFEKYNGSGPQARKYADIVFAKYSKLW